MNGPILFHRALLRKRRERAAGSFAAHDFLRREANARLAESLAVITRALPRVASFGADIAREGTGLVIHCDLARLHAARQARRAPRLRRGVAALRRRQPRCHRQRAGAAYGERPARRAGAGPPRAEAGRAVPRHPLRRRNAARAAPGLRRYRGFALRRRHPRASLLLPKYARRATCWRAPASPCPSPTASSSPSPIPIFMR